jgi:hypothetical protein
VINTEETIIAAALNLEIDYNQITSELLPLMQHSKCIPFNYPIDNSNVTAYSLFLRTSLQETDYSYRGAKSADIGSWIWDKDIPIPYTRRVIEKIPFTKLGTVRVVYFPSIPCVEHTDWDDPTDIEHTLGLSLIPNTADTHCNVWYEKEHRYVSIPGNAMLLNDSIRHNVPAGNGTRITMRIFGDIDYTWFRDKINHNICYYL